MNLDFYRCHTKTRRLGECLNNHVSPRLGIPLKIRDWPVLPRGPIFGIYFKV